MIPKKYLLLAAAVCSFLAGYGATAAFAAYPPGGVHGRARIHGYFLNISDGAGGDVLRPIYNGEAIAPGVNSADSFINFIRQKLAGGNGQDRTGAAFIIHTMLGSGTSSRSRPPSAAQMTEWEKRVRYLDSIGKVSWRVNYTFTINSYWQGDRGGGPNPDDDAFFDENGTKPAIVFRNANNQIVYAIKWECANPVGTGNLGPVPVAPNYNMSGRTTLNNSTPKPGDTITFNHYVRNGGPDTTPADIHWIGQNSVSGATTGSGNSGRYSNGQEKNVWNEQYTVPAGTAPNTQICRRVGYDPVNGAGARNGRGNPVCATVRYDHQLTPIITPYVNGTVATGGIAEAGDEVSFQYSVNNTGSTQSVNNTNCNIFGNTKAGSYTPSTPSESSSSGGYSAPTTGCPRSFPVGMTANFTGPDVITATQPNTTVCRSLFVNPRSPAGGTVDTEVCIRIAAKPYLKVLGGDVAAGNGLAAAGASGCTNNTSAGIRGWNRRDTADNTRDYAGAGTQYAAFALSTINDFASGQRSPGVAASPNGLSFASTTATNPGSTGVFGGSWGSATCIKNYYGELGNIPTAQVTTIGTDTVNVSSLNNGIYSRTGNLKLTNGNVTNGERMVVYVNGDVHIDGNITYPGVFNAGGLPLFQLVVRGDIYIGANVTELDGLYIAQPTGVTKGIIYTCASGDFTRPSLDGTLYDTCNGLGSNNTSTLTVNGSFIARSIEFLRTPGTLSNATYAEGANANTAETFNYSPSLWIPLPAWTGNQLENYDGISSLPPIL